jgi:hypothetical protein
MASQSNPPTTAHTHSGSSDGGELGNSTTKVDGASLVTYVQRKANVAILGLGGNNITTAGLAVNMATG